MKQLSVFCSHDLEQRVVAALDHAGVEGFFRTGGATGNKFMPRGNLPRTMTWDMTLFVVPGAEEAQVEAVVRELLEYAGSCELEPCLRIVVSAVERVI